MSKFLDGPAAGQHLALRRAPVMLRVVQGPGGKWDALDQLDDEPAADETIHLYRMVPDTLTTMHLCVRGKGRAASDFYAMGDYRYVEPQPDEATLRDRGRWVEWCDALRAKEAGDAHAQPDQDDQARPEAV